MYHFEFKTNSKIIWVLIQNDAWSVDGLNKTLKLVIIANY